MGRKIIMTGDEAQYIERRGANTIVDDREIRMEGKFARYEENSVSQAVHFPVNSNEVAGKQWFDFLIKNGFIAPDTEVACWLYVMGFSTDQPLDVRPIEWMKTLETARMMLYKVYGDMLNAKTISKSRIKELAQQCFTKKGEPLVLAKPKRENSLDADAIENFLPTFSDL